MTTSNGHVSLQDKKALWLDKALANQAPGVKARVLDFAVRFGVDSGDDDFWVLIAAVGYLNTIVEDAPQQWDGILATHTEHLNQWTESNLKLIESLALQAETDAQQAEITQELSNTLRALTKLLGRQQQHIGKLKLISGTYEQSSTGMRETLNHRLSELSNRQTTIAQQTAQDNQTLLSLIQAQQTNNRTRNRNDNLLSIIWIVLTAAIACLLWLGQQRQTYILQQVVERNQRIDCTTGVLPATSLACSRR